MPSYIPLQEVSRNTVFRETGGADFSVTEVKTVVRSTGERAQFNVVSVKNGTPGVVTLVRSADGRFLLGKHWRVSINQFAWEFPRGMGEDGEDIIHTAVREVEEETGISRQEFAREPVCIQLIYPDSGLQSTRVGVVDILLKEPCEYYQSSEDGDWELSGGVLWATRDELTDMIVKSQITDGITLSALCVWDGHNY
ncbi:NUDIX hydrolase [Alloscardovia omnicolens]|uniref:Nudix hydrolase domain-containing protein n=1 Tax=Alloscardovia omnicolens TaxID=419015 RepID=A0A2I1M4E8_9BIFI|nr:NUDIX hydrolase [Alloscardovia omnicolens]MDK6249916.1 NUDIX hydrolase [Alloscardovia omnicolens]MDK6251137.1 NUDIX hydrolase [Alloscardovia omnicolens]MDU6532313.1 NUDIX hydrolase [Alloscardovia omnicolens]MDU6641138.1 NUDIX hydrolase [Alloscardovia omnicolens]PKZ15003.1 hypothetical protein CYJ32_05770 [Alloscardovia omnicolens]